jgi:hypothetical protein
LQDGRLLFVITEGLEYCKARMRVGLTIRGQRIRL